MCYPIKWPLICGFCVVSAFYTAVSPLAFQLKLYNAVIDDVIHNVSDSFLDEGVDEQVLQELKQMWTAKMMASKAVEQAPESVDVPPPNVAKV